MYTTKAQICIRRDTAANFTSVNPTLALGEIAYETDTRNLKVGDGATAWTALPYINPYRAGTAAAPTSNTVMGSGAGVALTSATNNTIIGGAAGAQLTTGSTNTAVGVDALGISGTTAFNNVAVGWRAAWQSTGSSNVAVGLQTLSASGSHTHVTAVGTNAGLLNTANDTVAIGSGALDANTTGTGNTAVGRNALGSSATNTNGTAVGMSALALSTADGNTAVGAMALDACTTGTVNTAVGRDALGAMTTGNSSVAVGAAAGQALTTSINVVAIGTSAASSASTGANSCVAVGSSAFVAATTCSSSVAIGASAGRYRGASPGTDTVTSATESIFIGTQARAAADSQTNQIVIAGNNGLGNGSNTTTIGNSSTTETYLAGNVTVNGDDIYGATVVGGSRENNRVTFAGSNPACVVTNSSTNSMRVDISSNAGRVGSTNATDVHIMTNGLNRVTFTQGTGDMKVNNGNVVMSTAGTGIDFSAHSNAAGMTSELLNDYEEGTWTPAYAPTTGTFATMTMDVISATYVKIGRQVTVRAWIRTDNVDVTGGSGNLRITGAPFTCAADGHSGGAVNFASAFAANGTASSVHLIGGQPTIVLNKRATSDGATATVQVTDLTTGATADQNQVNFTATFFV